MRSFLRGAASLGWRSVRWAPGLAVIATLAAESGYEFQRAIEHRREFERELDTYRSRPNPARGSGGVVPESEIREWLEGRKAAASAWREQEASRRQAEEAEARDHQAAARERAAAVRQEEARWVERGVAAYDAPDLAKATLARPDGTYAKSETFRQAAQQVEPALRRFEQGLASEPFETSLTRARCVAYGVMAEADGRVVVAPATAAACCDAVAARFPDKRGEASDSAAYFYHRALSDAERWKAAELATRRESVARWARAAEQARDESYRGDFARAVMESGPSEIYSAHTESAIRWMAEVRDEERLRVTPFAPGRKLTALDQRALDAVDERARLLARFLQRLGRTTEAAHAYVKLLDRRGWPATANQGAIIDAFLTEYPAAVAALDAEEMKALQPFADSATAPALVRRLIQEDRAASPETVAARLERAARLSGDAGLALQAAYVYKGTVWEDFRDADGLLQLARWMLQEPRLRTAANREPLARMEALGLTLQRECSPAALAAARELAHVVKEGAYAEILLLTFGRGRTAETQRIALERIAALESVERDFQPWDQRLGAPTPRALRALAMLPELKTLDDAKRVVADLEGSRDPWVTAFMGHLLLDERRNEEAWDLGRLLLESAASRGIRLAAADLGAAMYFGRTGYRQDIPGALPFLRRGAEAGYPAAVYPLGLHYYEGDGGDRDPQKAFAWLSRVNEGPRADAQAKCAQLLVGGQLGAPDWAKALPFARTAAELGHPEGQYLYGVMIGQGYVQGQPASAALTWWERARQQKHALAARDLYIAGIKSGRPVDREQRVEEYVAFLEEAGMEEQFAGALLLLDDRPGGEKLGYRSEKRGHELIENLLERRHAGARAYYDAHEW